MGTMVYSLLWGSLCTSSKHELCGWGLSSSPDVKNGVLHFPPKQGDMYSGLLGYIANPKKLETGLRTSSAGIPYTLLLKD